MCCLCTEVMGKMGVYLITITPAGGVTVMVRPAIFLVNFVILLGRCYRQHLLILWQMLLPFVFDVVFSIRCY